MALELTNDGDTITVTDESLGVANGTPDVTYTLRLLTRKVYREIAARHTRKVPDRRTRQMSDDTDFEAVGEDLLDYVLVGWSGVNLKGEPAPCERDLKLKLDGTRTQAILEVAGMSRVQVSSPQESFRGAADVR